MHTNLSSCSQPSTPLPLPIPAEGKQKIGAGSIRDASPAWDNSLEPQTGTLTLAQPTPASSLRQLLRLRVFLEGVPELKQKEESYLHPVSGEQVPREQKYWAQDGGDAKLPPNAVIYAAVWRWMEKN